MYIILATVFTAVSFFFADVAASQFGKMVNNPVRKTVVKFIAVVVLYGVVAHYTPLIVFVIGCLIEIAFVRAVVYWATKKGYAKRV